MKAALISLGSVSSQWTIEAMKKYFDEVDEIDLRSIEVNLGKKSEPVLFEGEPLKDYDCIFAKGSFRYSGILHSLTLFLQGKSYMPINADAFTYAHNKLLTHLLLQKAEVPMPRTYFSPTVKAARQILEKVNYPIIMKFPQGTQGKGVMFADSFASASSVLDALETLKQPFLVQEYVETEGTDIRAIVVGDKVVAAMERQAVKGEARANIHAGGKGKAITLDNFTKKIAVQASRAVGADICGVDILEGPKGPVVIEVNISPGLQGITGVTKIDVADHIARFLFAKAQDMKTSQVKPTADEILKEVLEQDKPKEQKDEFISQLDFRGERILLPEVVTKHGGFSEDDEYTVHIEKGKLSIKKFIL